MSEASVLMMVVRRCRQLADEPLDPDDYDLEWERGRRALARQLAEEFQATHDTLGLR